MVLYFCVKALVASVAYTYFLDFDPIVGGGLKSSQTGNFSPEWWLQIVLSTQGHWRHLFFIHRYTIFMPLVCSKCQELLTSESSSVIFYAKYGIGKLVKRWLGVEHDTVLFSSVQEAVQSAKRYDWSQLCLHLL